MLNFLKSNKKHKYILIAIIFVFLIFQSIPYLYGYSISNDSFVFTTFMKIRVDLVSYIGKIKQGIEGNWLFALDYSHEPTEKHFIYFYYLFLGHIANFFKISALQIFNIARITSSILTLLSLYRFLYYSLIDFPNYVFYTVLITSIFSRGISIFIESNILIASQFSAHLPLALSIIYYLLTPSPIKTWKKYLSFFILSFILGLISTFSIITVLLIISTTIMLKLYYKKDIKNDLISLIIIGNGGGWIVLYQYIILNTKPDLQQWTIQNSLNPKPFYYIILSFSPIIIFSFIFIIKNVFFKKKNNDSLFYIISWVLLFPIFIIIPFTLKLRFFIGIFPAIACLGILIIFEIFEKYNYKILTFILIVISFTDACIYTYYKTQEIYHDYLSSVPEMFIPINIYQSFQWINKNLPKDSLILSSYSNGNFIPAFTNSRSVVGHWCETPNYRQNKEFVTQFYEGNLTEQNLQQLGVDYIYYSNIESNIGEGVIESDWVEVYQDQDIHIYKVVY